MSGAMQQWIYYLNCINEYGTGAGLAEELSSTNNKILLPISGEIGPMDFTEAYNYRYF